MMLETSYTGLNLRLLALFQAIMRTRSVSAAADALGMPQSNASRDLHRLRKIFDDELFIRGSSTMIPTVHAIYLADRIDRMLDIAGSLEPVSDSFSPDSHKREFNIACPDLGQWAILEAFSKIIAQHPKIGLRTASIADSDVHAALEQGEIDVAVGLYDLLQSGIRKQLVAESVYALACRDGHPFAQDPSLEKFLSSDHVIGMHDYCGPMYRAVETALLAVLPPDRIRIHCGSYTAALLSLRNNDLIMAVPQLIVRHSLRQLGLQIVRPPLRLPRFVIYQYWHDRSDKDPGHRWFRRALRDAIIFADHPRTEHSDIA